MHLADTFIQSDLLRLKKFFCICVPWELNPQPLALLTQCSTTEPREHFFALPIPIYVYSLVFVFHIIALSMERT